MCGVECPACLGSGHVWISEARSSTRRRVAALYVDPEGPYSRFGDRVDVWDASRDARRYAGPHPVVAHPPCGPWGRFWWRYRGGEGGADCAIAAVEAVRRYGGVLEHPAESGLWGRATRRQAHLKVRDSRESERPVGLSDLPLPGRPADAYGGYTVQVNQVDWGHPAIKSTWLYIVGVPRQRLPSFPATGKPTHTMVRRRDNPHELPEVPKRLRHLTPPRFARWLVDLASRVER